MCNFGLSFSDDFSGMGRPPKGFVPARLTLGDFSERVFCDEAVWTISDYSRHWRETATRCVDGKRSALFCSSLSHDNADLWIGINLGEIVRFFDLMTPVDLLNVDGPIIEPRKSFDEFLGEPSPEWSIWEVPTAYLRCLADRA